MTFQDVNWTLGQDDPAFIDQVVAASLDYTQTNLPPDVVGASASDRAAAAIPRIWLTYFQGWDENWLNQNIYPPLSALLAQTILPQGPVNAGTLQPAAVMEPTWLPDFLIWMKRWRWAMDELAGLHGLPRFEHDPLEYAVMNDVPGLFQPAPADGDLEQLAGSFAIYYSDATRPPSFRVQTQLIPLIQSSLQALY